jgi:Fe-S-cluster containining protein
VTATLREQFPRTSCDCRLCKAPCRVLPGALAPEDLPAIAAHLGTTPDDKQFLETYLQASDGARVAMRDDFGNLREFSVPSLVPKLLPTGCVFLDDEGRCKIHAVSPAACALLDMHQSADEGRPRAEALVRQQMLSHERNDEYSRAVKHLEAVGCQAPPLAERRRRFIVETARVEEELKREGSLP